MGGWLVVRMDRVVNMWRGGGRTAGDGGRTRGSAVSLSIVDRYRNEVAMKERRRNRDSGCPRRGCVGKLLSSFGGMGSAGGVRGVI